MESSIHKYLNTQVQTQWIMLNNTITTHCKDKLIYYHDYNSNNNIKLIGSQQFNETWNLCGKDILFIAKRLILIDIIRV